MFKTQARTFRSFCSISAPLAIKSCSMSVNPYRAAITNTGVRD